MAATVNVTTRPAELADAAALEAIDEATWSPRVTPSDYHPGQYFDRINPDDVIVALAAGRVAGFVLLRRPTPLASNSHVLMVGGLAVSPGHQRQGVGRRLMAAAEEEAARRRASRLTLHVLSANEGAVGFYERQGYEVEGVLRGEFLLPVGSGAALELVDDILMAKALRPH
jgi:ribosomal protein S18 acetylase RimI-like enzyme